MKSNASTEEMLIVPYKQIEVPDRPGANIRSDLPRIAELAESLKMNGQLYPVIVRRKPGAPKDKPFVLVEGFRRMAAFAELGWQGREIMVIVREYKKTGSHLDRTADNWVANNHREGFIPMDLAQCVRSLVDGTYEVDEGEVAKPYDKEEVAKRFQISMNSMNKLLKLARTLPPEVAEKASKIEAPLRVMLPLIQIEGEGEDREAQEKDRVRKQHHLLDTWDEQQKRLAASGRKRAERVDKGKKKTADSTPPAPINPSRKVGPEETVLRRPVADYVEVIREKLETVKGTEKSYYEGMFDAFRFLTNKLTKLPGLTAKDFKTLDAAQEEASDEAAEE